MLDLLSIASRKNNIIVIIVKIIFAIMQLFPNVCGMSGQEQKIIIKRLSPEYKQKI